MFCNQSYASLKYFASYMPRLISHICHQIFYLYPTNMHFASSISPMYPTKYRPLLHSTSIILQLCPPSYIQCFILSSHIPQQTIHTTAKTSTLYPTTYITHHQSNILHPTPHDLHQLYFGQNLKRFYEIFCIHIQMGL